jgi:hypothetical protein
LKRACCVVVLLMENLSDATFLSHKLRRQQQQERGSLQQYTNLWLKVFEINSWLILVHIATTFLLRYGPY